MMRWPTAQFALVSVAIPAEQDIDDAIAKVRHAVTKLRELSPLWDMFKDGVDLSQVEWAAH